MSNETASCVGCHRRSLPAVGTLEDPPVSLDDSSSPSSTTSTAAAAAAAAEEALHDALQGFNFDDDEAPAPASTAATAAAAAVAADNDPALTPTVNETAGGVSFDLYSGLPDSDYASYPASRRAEQDEEAERPVRYTGVENAAEPKAKKRRAFQRQAKEAAAAAAACSPLPEPATDEQMREAAQQNVDAFAALLLGCTLPLVLPSIDPMVVADAFSVPGLFGACRTDLQRVLVWAVVLETAIFQVAFALGDRVDMQLGELVLLLHEWAPAFDDAQQVAITDVFLILGIGELNARNRALHGFLNKCSAEQLARLADLLACAACSLVEAFDPVPPDRASAAVCPRCLLFVIERVVSVEGTVREVVARACGKAELLMFSDGDVFPTLSKLVQMTSVYGRAVTEVCGERFRSSVARLAKLRDRNFHSLHLMTSEDLEEMLTICEKLGSRS